MEANARDLSFEVTPVAPGIDVAVDRQLLAGAVVNLLQNAFKFTCPQGRVSLNTVVTAQSVLIEVHDQCGGLPVGKAEELFQPFVQRNVAQTGLGLGLSISRRSIQAIGGQLRVRDMPGVGCVFTVELSRV
jgi:hypothetical protein